MFYITAGVFCVLLLRVHGLQTSNQSSQVDNRHGSLDCRPSYGCFPLGPPWLSHERPVSLPPLLLGEIKPCFQFFTSALQEGVTIDENNVTALINIPTSPDLRVILIAHGFIESGDIPWVRSMAKALLKTQATAGPVGSNKVDSTGEDSVKVAVVVVDWRHGAMPPYAQAVANIRLVGAVTGHFIILLQVSSTSFHLVGHSLGAHLMGYAGTFVSRHSAGLNLLGRITALDPAGPYFRHADPLVRLDPTDAQFVDVLHTDNSEIVPGIPVSLGNPDALGHVDFYPNGGGLQPGCSTSLGEEMIVQSTDVVSAFLGFMGCHHQRSIHYFIESILNSCSFLAVECSSREVFEEGRCWDCSKHYCSWMGFHSTPEGHKVNESNSNIATINNNSVYHENTYSDHGKDVSIKVTIESFIAAVRETFDDVMKQPGDVGNGATVDQLGEGGGNNMNNLTIKSLYHFLDQMVDLAQNLSHLRQKRENVEAVASKKMFLVTRNSYPFCGTQLRVTVTASSSAESRRHGGDVAQFSLVLRGSTGTAFVSIPQQEAMFLSPGESTSTVIATQNTGVLQEMQVTFLQPQDLLHYLLLFRFETPVVYVDSFVVEDLASGYMTVMPAIPQKFVLGEKRSLLPAA